MDRKKFDGAESSIDTPQERLALVEQDLGKMEGRLKAFGAVNQSLRTFVEQYEGLIASFDRALAAGEWDTVEASSASFTPPARGAKKTLH